MKYSAVAFLVAFGVCAVPPPALAYRPRPQPDITVTAPPPAGAPSQEEVLRALPGGAPRGLVRIRYRLLAQRVGPVRLYPLVGPARLVETRFECTVQGVRGRE